MSKIVLGKFTIVDEFACNYDEILNIVRSILDQEALEHGWATGYTFREFQDPEHLPAGGVSYFFEVEGTYDEEN